MNDSIMRRQKEFQILAGIDLGKDKEILSENFIFKTIEELVELRKEIPSGFNKFEKVPKVFTRTGVLGELSDVMLFICNFMLVWDISKAELIKAMLNKQNQNFDKLLEKKGEDK